MTTVTLAELTPDGFAPYGEVFAPHAATARVDRVARLQNNRADAEANLFMARTGLTTLPHRFDRMESHPGSSQSFVPMGDAPIVIAVALPDPAGQPDLATLRGFLARVTGFSYRAGIWHLPVASLEATMPIVGFMYENGSPQDCVWADVAPRTLIAG